MKSLAGIMNFERFSNKWGSQITSTLLTSIDTVSSETTGPIKNWLHNIWNLGHSNKLIIKNCGGALIPPYITLAKMLCPLFPRKYNSFQKLIRRTESRGILLSQIRIKAGEDVLLEDNLEDQNWKVRNGKGEVGSVPALAIVIPGLDKEAIEASARWEYTIHRAKSEHFRLLLPTATTSNLQNLLRGSVMLTKYIGGKTHL